MKTIILFGASSAIARAYVKHLQNQATKFNIVCVSSSNAVSQNSDNISYYNTDYSADSLSGLTQHFKDEQADIHQVIMFNGKLHNTEHMPEKKLEDINADYFNLLLNANTLTPLLCLQSVLPLINHKTMLPVPMTFCASWSGAGMLVFGTSGSGASFSPVAWEDTGSTQ